MTRNDTILTGIDCSMRILEIGPSFSPIAPKADGWNTCAVDHASTEELIEKFRDNPDTDVSRIEPVDVVWNGGPLDAAVPEAEHGTFDACIVSHVLEHMPDPIGFFQSLEPVLTARGIVAFALPDKRSCFDFFKAVTTTGELLDAHERGATRHSKRAIFDFLAYNVYADGAHGWARRPIGEMTFFGTLAAAKQTYDEASADAGAEYIDCHAWHFTPSSFELLMVELAALGQIGFSIEYTHPTVGHEFYVTMRRGTILPSTDAALERTRLKLLRQTWAEIRDQADCLLGAASTELGSEAAASRYGAAPMPTDWPQDTVLVRKQLARYLSGEGIDVGPGPHPFPVAYPGASIQRVDRWDPGENARLYPELVDASFPAPDVVCDLNVDLLSAFGDGKLDFVVASHVLEHVADPLGLLDDMHRVLQPDGVALILLPDRRLTFDSGRPATRIEALVRKHEDGVTAVADADIDDFLRYADPDAFGSLMATAPDARAEIYEWHRHRSIHVHCWHEQEFVDVLTYAMREMGHTWEFLDGVIAEDEGPNGFEFGYVLRKSTGALDAVTAANRFDAVWSQWVADRRRLHTYVSTRASVSAEVSALQSELDAFRSRRIVRATDRAIDLIRQAKSHAMKPVRQS